MLKKNCLPFLLVFLPKTLFAAEPHYIVSPHLIKNESLPAYVTKTPLNAHRIDHTTKGHMNVGVIYGENLDVSTIYGDHRNENIYFNLLYSVTSYVEQSLSRDNIFTSDQQGLYIQLTTAARNQEIIIQKTSPQTMMGMNMQMSFTGSCSVLNMNADPNSQCSFLPSLITDRESIEPDFFIPTRIEQLGNIGDEVTEESLAILSQPGFQSLGADGQRIGLDLYLPNMGSTPGNSISQTSHVSREEKIENFVLGGVSRVRKIIQTNHEKAAMGITLNGFGGVWSNDNIEINLPLCAAVQLLPDVMPWLNGSDRPANTNINKILFNAAQNTRLPENSWTFYQASLGSADHVRVENNIKVEPKAYFNTLWLGLSPVKEVSSSYQFHYDLLGDERVTMSTGGEGGMDENISFASSSSSSSQQTVTTSVSLDKFYIQAYLTMLETDINLIETTQLSYKTIYYPHLSYSGNLTGTSFAWRYYTGLIFSNSVKSYLGTDYTHAFRKNWTVYGAAIGYINPDQDYFSRVESRLTRNVSLWKANNISLFTSFRYAFDRPDAEEMLTLTDYLADPVDNYVNVGAQLNINGWLSVMAAYNFGKVLEDSVDSSWSFSGSAKVNDHLALQANFSPSTNQEQYGCSAVLASGGGKGQAKKQLALGWKHQTYEYGYDSFNHLLTTDHDYYTLTFSYRW